MVETRWTSDDIMRVAKVLIDNGYLPNVHSTGSLEWKHMSVIEGWSGIQIGKVKFESGKYYSIKRHNTPEIRSESIWDKILEVIREDNAPS